MKGNTNASVAAGTMVELQLPANPSGMTLTKRDNRPIRAMRTGNMIHVHAAIVINGTFTGTTGWTQVLPAVDSLLAPGEAAMPPWLLYTPASNQTFQMELLQGIYVYLTNSHTYNNIFLDIELTWFVFKE